ncbi:MAG: DUF2723 domain-containing protein [Thermoanaerobaculia bacterium]
MLSGIAATFRSERPNVTSLGRSGSDRTIAAGLSAASFALYASGACRTIYVGDSGELVAAVHTLGIPHPSGYPLYVLLGKLWTVLVPFGSVAFRMSLFSALFAALAVGLVYRSARALGTGTGAALVGAIALAASPSFWGEANVQRVYALNAFFVAAATLLAIRFVRELRAPPSEGDAAAAAESTRRRRSLFVAIAFLSGLGATNHTFLAVWGLCFLIYVLVTDPHTLRSVRTLAAATLAAAAGLSVYLYLPLRSRQEPRLDWGNPETLDAWLAVVTRRDFWQRRWWTGWPDLIPIARDFLTSFAKEFTVAGALLVLVGLVVGLSRRRFVGERGRPALLFLLVCLANLAAMASHGSRTDIFVWHRYYIPAYIAGALLLAMGLEAIANGLRAISPRVASALLGIVLVASTLLVPWRFREFDRSRYRIAEDYSRRILAELPPGAHLAASDDNILFVLIYLQLVEGTRPDVDLILQGVGGELPSLHFDPDREPLFFTHHPNWRFPALELVPVGLLFRVARVGSPPSPIADESAPLAGESDPRVPQDYLTRNLVGEFHFMRGVTLERPAPQRAIVELEAAAHAAPDNDVLFYNLGLIYDRMGFEAQALAAFERAAEINPRPIPGADRVLAADRIAELRERQRGASPPPDR